jgi:hypothetical protein
MSDIGRPLRWNTLDTLALTLAVTAGLAWLGVSMICFGMGFESSEYEQSADRWWHDQLSCAPIWLAFLGFSGVSGLAILYRRRALAFLVVATSAAAFYALFVAGLADYLF